MRDTYKKRIYAAIAVSAVAIVAAQEIPVEAANLKLGDKALGEIIQIKENGVNKPYLILEHTANGETIVVRQRIIDSPKSVFSNAPYSPADPAAFFRDSVIFRDVLNGTFYNSLDATTRASMVTKNWRHVLYTLASNGGLLSINNYYTEGKVSLMSLRDLPRYKNSLVNLKTSEILDSNGYVDGFNPEWMADDYVQLSSSSGIWKQGKIITNNASFSASTYFDNDDTYLSFDETNQLTFKYGYRPMFSLNSKTILQSDNSIANDTTGPTISVTEQTGFGATSAISVNATDSQTDISSIRYAQGNYTADNFPVSSSIDITSSKRFTASTNGPYTVYSSDTMGNKSVAIINVSKVDATAPTVTLSPSNTDITNQNISISVNATDSQSGISVLKWGLGNLNSTHFLSAGSSVMNGGSFTATSNGIYTVFVQDGAGNQTLKTINVSNIDKTAPLVSFGANGNAATAKMHSTVAHVTDNVMLTKAEYQITQSDIAPSNGAWIPLVTGSVISTPTDGNGDYYIHIRATDSANNETSIVSNKFVVDNTAPTVPTINASTTAPTKDSVSVTILYPIDATEKEYRVDGGAWVTYNDAITISDNGKLEARAIDSAGNISDLGTLDIENIDKTAPLVSFETNGNETVAKMHSTVVHVADNVTLTKADYQITQSDATPSNSTWVPFVAGSVISTPTDGNGDYYIHIRATDSANNETNVVSNKFVVDNTAPTVPTFIANTTTPTKDSVSVTILYPIDAAEKEYRVDNGAWVVYNDAITMSDNGKIEARAIDSAGNISNLGALEIENIDKVNPIITITNNEDAVAYDAANYFVEVDENQELKRVEILKGVREVNDFNNEGRELVTNTTGEFEIKENGSYTALAEDVAGNVVLREFHVNNINPLRYIELEITKWEEERGNNLTDEVIGKYLRKIKDDSNGNDFSELVNRIEKIINEKITNIADESYGKTLTTQEYEEIQNRIETLVGLISNESNAVTAIEKSAEFLRIKEIRTGMKEYEDKVESTDEKDSFLMKELISSVIGLREAISKENLENPKIKEIERKTEEFLNHLILSIEQSDEVERKKLASELIEELEGLYTPASSEQTEWVSGALEDIIKVSLQAELIEYIKDKNEDLKEDKGVEEIAEGNEILDKLIELVQDEESKGSLKDEKEELVKINDTNNSIKENTDIVKAITELDGGQIGIELKTKADELKTVVNDLQDMILALTNEKIKNELMDLLAIIKNALNELELKLNEIIYGKDDDHNRVIITEQNYAFLLNDVDVYIEKQDVESILSNEEKIKVKHNLSTQGSYIEIGKAVNGKEEAVVLKDYSNVKFKNSPKGIAFKNADDGLQFVPQYQGDGEVEIKILTSAEITFNDGFNAEFVDIPKNVFSKANVDSLVEYGLVKGVTENEFGGHRNITRAEYAVLLTRSLGIEVDNVNASSFEDVNFDAWYGKSIQALYEAGYIVGTSATTFSPNKEITREEAAVLMNRMITRNSEIGELVPREMKDLDAVANYAKDSAQVLYQLGIINGFGKEGVFAPKEKMTRYQMAAILDATLKEIKFKN